LFKKRTNKHGNVWTQVDGIKFQSKGEALYYQVLKLREKAGEISDLKLQVNYALKVNGTKIGDYRADFVYKEPDAIGSIVDDFKGQETDLFKWKWKHLQAQYGHEYHYRVTKLKDVRPILKRFGFDYDRKTYMIYRL
jgi:hypothetical protein